jgi:hypothetical protein
MSDFVARTPDDDEVVAHGFDGHDAMIAVGQGYGTGKPHFYVWLDVDNGKQLWWLDAADAERLGTLLVKEAAACRGLADPQSE